MQMYTCMSLTSPWLISPWLMLVSMYTCMSHEPMNHANEPMSHEPMTHANEPMSHEPMSHANEPMKRTPLEGFVRFFEGGPLTHGSWWGNIVNRKPPRGGGFLSINLSIHVTWPIHTCDTHTWQSASEVQDAIYPPSWNQPECPHGSSLPLRAQVVLKNHPEGFPAAGLPGKIVLYILYIYINICRFCHVYRALLSWI